MRLRFLTHKRGNDQRNERDVPSRSTQCQLMKEVRRRDWEGARQTLAACPASAAYRSASNGKTPLHVALMNRAPRDVVEQLLEANPNALLVQDTEGWTPLHVIILYGGHDGEEITLRIIRQGGRIGGCLPSRYVGSPLHLACRHGCSHKVLAELLDVSPNQARVRNEAGMTPANLAWKTFVRQKSPRGLKEPSHAQTLLEQLCLLLSASAGLSKLDPPRAAAVVPSFGQALDFQRRYADETDFVSLLLWFHPRILHDPRAFPLHRACAYELMGKPQPPPPSPVTYSVASSSTTVPQDPLELVVERLDRGCLVSACSSRDDVGRLPLHWAVSAGKRRWRTGRVEDLVRLFPHALQVRDPVTGLYPSQLAAAPTLSADYLDRATPGLYHAVLENAVTRESRDSILIVETAFELLRSAPQVIRLH